MILVVIVELVVHVYRLLHTLCDCQGSRAGLTCIGLYILDLLTFWPLYAGIIVSVNDFNYITRSKEGSKSYWYEDNGYKHESWNHPFWSKNWLACWKFLLCKPRIWKGYIRKEISICTKLGTQTDILNQIDKNTQGMNRRTNPKWFNILHLLKIYRWNINILLLLPSLN